MKSGMIKFIAMLSMFLALAACMEATRQTEDVPPRTIAVRHIDLPVEAKEPAILYYGLMRAGDGLRHISSQPYTRVTFEADCTDRLYPSGACPIDSPLAGVSSGLDWGVTKETERAFRFWQGFIRQADIFSRNYSPSNRYSREHNIEKLNEKRKWAKGALATINALEAIKLKGIFSDLTALKRSLTENQKGIEVELSKLGVEVSNPLREERECDDCTKITSWKLIPEEKLMNDAVATTEADAAEAEALDQASQAAEDDFCTAHPSAPECY